MVNAFVDVYYDELDLENVLSCYYGEYTQEDYKKLHDYFYGEESEKHCTRLEEKMMEAAEGVIHAVIEELILTD